MRDPGGGNAVVHSPLHKYIKNFSIDFFAHILYFGIFYKNKKGSSYLELPLFINGKVAGNVNIAFLNEFINYGLLRNCLAYSDPYELIFSNDSANSSLSIK